MSQKISLVHFSMSTYAEWFVRGKANRNYHVFELLRANSSVDKILSIDVLPHSWKRGVRSLVDYFRAAPYGKVIHRSFFSRLIKVTDRLYIYQTIEPLISQKFFMKKLRGIIKDLDLVNTVVWSFIPTYVSYIGALDERVSVFDTVDDWSCHPAYQLIKQKLIKNYEYINRHADGIFTVSEQLTQKFYDANPHAFTVTNGVDLKHFSTQQPEPDDMKQLPHPRVCYVGVIQQRVDFQMVHEAAVLSPDVSFIFIGPIWHDADIGTVKNLKNVYFLGAKKYNQLPGYIQHSDIGLLPHHLNDLVQSMNPLKLYEYLASGKPIISTPVPGTEQFSSDFITIVRNGRALAGAIRSVMSRQQLLKPQQLQDSVLSYSWESKVHSMLQKVFAAYR
ncbi:MAG TPA: hypothetical protein DIS62_02705 [Candidatus Kerfeldbacteria bacterium]|nr:hypothetical protein [Candidatus Kerfeldbacteria bacterium]